EDNSPQDDENNEDGRIIGHWVSLPTALWVSFIIGWGPEKRVNLRSRNLRPPILKMRIPLPAALIYFYHEPREEGKGRIE
ncbi:MAG: hypothetical protein ACM3N7_00945, partial [Planctomycetaceae bacterium]